MLAPMPGNTDPAALPPDLHAVLMQLGTTVDGAPFVPASTASSRIGRPFHWLGWRPSFVPRVLMRARNKSGHAADFSRRGMGPPAAADIVAQLPGLPQSAAPDATTTGRVLATIERYATTSPEMVMFATAHPSAPANNNVANRVVIDPQSR